MKESVRSMRVINERKKWMKREDNEKKIIPR
jgi:hypothetical protein